jgi:protein-disulfide isomerase
MAIEDEPEDLTRKQRREQARAERKALQEAEAAHAVRRRRLVQLGGVIGAVVVVIIVIVVATSSGKGPSPATDTSPGAHTQEVAQVSSLLHGIPQSGNVLGDPNAPVTMQYFGDLECPVCQEFTLSTLPTLIEKYVRTGKMKIEYHSLETATRDPETFHTQQIAALAAGKQNLMWAYVELFYHEQGQEDTGYVTEAYLQGLAQQVPGLSLAKWTVARSDPTYANQVSTDAQSANANSFTGTPSFLLGKTGETLQPFSPSSFSEPSAFTPTIDKLLA